MQKRMTSSLWVLGLTLVLAQMALGQATAVITATRDYNGAEGPASAYDHQDMINDYRGEVSLREALTYANDNRIKVGRRVTQTVNSSPTGGGVGGQPWVGGPTQQASPFAVNNTDGWGGATPWYRLGGDTIMPTTPPAPPAVMPAPPYFVNNPDWTNNGNGGGNQGVPGDNSSPGSPLSRVLVVRDNAGYGSPHTYAQATDNTYHIATVAGQSLRFQNFGFQIPSGSTIASIQVRLHTFVRNGPEGGPDYRGVWTRNIQLLRAGNPDGPSQSLGRNESRWSGDPDAGTPNVRTYGAGGLAPQGGLWGGVWSPADINDPAFGFQIQTDAEFGWGGSNDANVSGRAEQWGIIDLVEVTINVLPAPNPSALIKADDTQRIPVTLAPGQHSEQLVMRDWRFTVPTQLVPDDARITGIAARIVRSVAPGSGAVVRDVGVVLQRPQPGDTSGAPTAVQYSGNSLAMPNSWPDSNPSGFEVAGTYGGNTDTWGFGNLTGKDINDPRFGIDLVAINAGTTPATAYVNYAEIAIWWEDPVATPYIKNDLTITMDSAKNVFVYYPSPMAPTSLPPIMRDNVTINGEINGDGQPDLNINCSMLGQNKAPTGVLTTSVTDDPATYWRRWGLSVGTRVPMAGRATPVRVQDVVIEGVMVYGGATGGSSAWVPGVWLANGDNIKLANSDCNNLGIGVLTSVGLNGTTPDKCYIGSQTPGSECQIYNCVNAGVYSIGAGQTLAQRATISDNGTSPGGLDPYSANVVLAGTGDNVIGGTASGAGNLISRVNAQITSVAGTGYGVTVPGSGLNTIQNNTITNHLAPGVWICSKGETGLPAGRTKPRPTIVGGSAPNAANQITNNGLAPGSNLQFTNHAGVWVTGLAGDDSPTPQTSPVRSEYNLVQGNTITGNGGAGVFLEGPGKTRVGGVATTARNFIHNNGSLGGANGVEQNGVEIRSTGVHYGDRRNPMTAADTNKVYANIVENNDINNNRHGINVIGTDENLIGGAQAASLNAIFQNSGDGVRIQGSGSTTITSNYIGLSRDGAPAGNGVNGVEVTAGATGDNIIGGSSVSERNVISANSSNGVSILGNDGYVTRDGNGNDDGYNSRVTGNYIGLAPNGAGGLGNGGNGVAITQQATGANVIGGRQPGERNFICANGQYGISIEGDATGLSNVVKGNFVGLGDGDTAGTTTPAAVGNRTGGILVNAAAPQTIGGPLLGDGNFIAANNPDSTSADGVQLTGAGSHVVLGNAIGGCPQQTSGWPGDPSLTASAAGYGNGGAGVFIDTASIGNITVGGTGPNDGNTILANGRQGINMAGTGIATVYNNRIGAGPTDAAGSSFVDLGNLAEGILISGAGANVIGGVDAHMGNIISGNGSHGINIPASGNNSIVRNRIGTNDTGQAAIANDGNGVNITGTGTNTLTANTISGNGRSGVYFRASGRLNMLANLVGTNVVGDDLAQPLAAVTRLANAALPNAEYGVNLPSGHTGRLLLGDGTDPGRNTISGNARNGVQVQGGVINDIHHNMIGVSSDGATAVANGGDGIYVDNLLQPSPSNGIASTDPRTVNGIINWGNAIHGNTIGGNTGNGVRVVSGSTVFWANQIGVSDVAGARRAVGNAQHGILVNDKNLVTTRQNIHVGPVAPIMSGGTAPRADVGNIIGGNGGDGINLTQAGGQAGLPTPHDVVIYGNRIGVDLDVALPNQGNGIKVERGLTGKVLIGTTPGSAVLRNVISGNGGWGLNYQARYATGNGPLIYNNLIGTNAAGLLPVPNVSGGVRIDIDDATRLVKIGEHPDTPVPGRGARTFANLIGGNGGPGIYYATPAKGQIVGNYIGLGVDSTTPVGNRMEGVRIEVGDTGTVEVGGVNATHALRNLFVGNGSAAAADVPRAAVTVVSGVAHIVDNLFGWSEGTPGNPTALAGGGNPGGGVWFRSGTTQGSTLSIPAGTTIFGSGAANSQPGVRLDTTWPVGLAAVPVDGGFGPGYDLHATADVTLTDSPSTNNRIQGVRVDKVNTGAVTLVNSALTGNTGGGLVSSGAGAVSLTNSLVAKNGTGGISSLTDVILRTSDVVENDGNGVTIASGGTGQISAPDITIARNTGYGVRSAGSGVVSVQGGQLDDNAAGGALITGSGPANFINLSVQRNGQGATPGAGLDLRGSGLYKVRQSTISESGADGVRLGASGAAVSGASVGNAAASEWLDRSAVAGQASGNTANLIKANAGWGVNISNGSGCVVNGNIIVDNLGGGLNSVLPVAPTFYLNGLYKTGASTIRISGVAPANQRVEIFEAKDPQLGSNDPTATHRGQVYQRLGTVTSTAAGTFSLDVPTSVFVQTDDTLRLATATIVDASTGNTTAYATNTGQVASATGFEADLTVVPSSIQAENVPNRQKSTLTLTLRDVLGNPVPGVGGVALSIASPTPHAFLTMVPAEGTAQRTAAPTATDAGGWIKATVSATDRVNCQDTKATFAATVNGVALDLSKQVPEPVLTITSGNPETAQTTLSVDPITNPSVRPLADGTDTVTLRISIHDNSASHCILSGFSKDRVRVVQVSGPAGAQAIISPPAADSDAKGELTVTVAATEAGSYVFGVQTDVGNDGWDASDDMPAAQNKTVIFKPGAIDATASTATVDKAVARANGAKGTDGAIDAASLVKLNLTIVDAQGNAPVPAIPSSDIIIKGARPGATPLTEADGLFITVDGPTDAEGKTSATIRSTKVAIIQFTTVIRKNGVDTGLVAKPQVDFRAPLSAANSTATVSIDTVKADNSDSATMTITVLDAMPTPEPVAGLSPGSIVITPSPSDGVIIVDQTGTNAQGVATATIRGNMAAVPSKVTFTVTVKWPAVAQPAAGIAQVQPITLTQKPVINFTVGDGKTITLTTDKTELRPNGRDTATLTATLHDQADHPVPGQTVIITVGDGRGVNPPVQQVTTTNAQGKVTATVTGTQENINPGALLQASLVPPGGQPTKLAEIRIIFRWPDPDRTKSTVTISAPNPLLADNNSAITGTIQLLDSAGAAIPGVDPARIKVTAYKAGTNTVASGVTITGPTLATDASGKTTFTAVSSVPQKLDFRVTITPQLGGTPYTLVAAAPAEFLGYQIQSYSPGLHMMAVSAVPRDPRPQAVLRQLTNFGLATWVGSRQAYSKYNPQANQPEMNMLSGRGFWLSLPDYAELAVVGDTLDASQPFPAAGSAPWPLSRGWNMVGNPWSQAKVFRLANIEVYQNGAFVGTLASAAGQALLEPYVWRWDPVQQYLLVLDPSAAASASVGSTIDAGRSVWWYAKQAGVAIRLKPGTRAEETKAETRAEATPQAWTVTIDAAIEGGASQVFLGAGDRSMRAQLPPAAPVEPAIRAEIVDTEGRAAADVRQGPFTKRQVWDLQVTALRAGDVTLSWKGLSRSLPENHRLILVDPTNGDRVLMNSRSAFTYATKGGTRAFKVELDPHGNRNLNITNVSAGLSRSRAQGVPFSVTLTTEADLALTIKGLGGRVVRQLTSQGAAGTNAISWDGKDADGRLVPAGAYLVEVTAFTKEGEIAKQVVNITVQ